MHQLLIPAPPPSMDSFAPEFCFCGNKTVESHEFWFCSTHCARLDSLRSLDDPECHYREVVRKAYVRAGVPELYPHRMMSVDQLCPSPSEQRAFVDAPCRPLPPTGSTPHNPNTAALPTLSQVAGKVLSKKAMAGEPLVSAKHDQKRRDLPEAPSHVHPAQSPQGLPLDAIPPSELTRTRSLRRVAQSRDGLRNNIRKSVAALLSGSKLRRDKESENPGRIFGHDTNPITPPTRKESLPSHRQMSPSSAVPVQRSTLRRSRSFAGWGVTPRSDPAKERDTVMDIISEMRDDGPENVDPRSLFDLQELC